MKKSKVVIIVPVRMDSTRFPGKPLVLVDGTPLVIRAAEAAKKSGVGEVIIACDCQQIADIVDIYGYKSIITPAELPSGSDRVAFAHNLLGKEYDADIIVNVQGDLAHFDNCMINQGIELIESNNSIDIATPVLKSKSCEENNMVKAAISFTADNNESGRVLYFSRSSIPCGAEYIYSHVGMYIYRKSALHKFYMHAVPTYLELTEKLEQLRALEIGLSVHAFVADNCEVVEVNTEQELHNANKYFKNKK